MYNITATKAIMGRQNLQIIIQEFIELAKIILYI